MIQKHQSRVKSKPRDPDYVAERLARNQRKARVQQVREQELTYADERPTRFSDQGWPFPLGAWPGF